MNKNYLIKNVEKQTGLSQHIIRIWERRYKAVTPARSETGRRVYTERDIERLKLIKQLTEDEYRISQVATLSLEKLKNLCLRIKKIIPPPTAKPAFEIKDLVASSLEAIGNLDSSTLDLCLAQASITMSPVLIVENFMIPLINKIGDEWRSGTLRAVHAQFATSLIRPFLIGLSKGDANPPGNPLILGALLQGQLHEFGILFSLAFAAVTGWRTNYLGPSLKTEEIAAGVHQLSPKVIVLNLEYPFNDPLIYKELIQLKKLIPASVHIITGGPVAESLWLGASSPGVKVDNENEGLEPLAQVLNEIGVEHVQNLDELRIVLSKLYTEEKLSPSL